MNFRFSKHSREQMEARKISEEIILNALNNPDQIIKEEYAIVYQKIAHENAGKFLIRIFVNENVVPGLIITVYKTSKISKYYEGKI